MSPPPATRTRLSGAVPIKEDAAWDGQSKGSALGNLIFLRLITRFGPVPAYALLSMVALRYALFDSRTISAIRDFRSHLGLPTRMLDVYRHVFSFGVNLIDTIAYLSGRTRPYRFSHVGLEAIAQPIAAGGGCILLSAHIGNWEVAANMLPVNRSFRVNVVMLDNERENVRRVLRKATDNRQVEVITLGGGPLEVMLRVRRALQNNEMVCFLGDRTVAGQPAKKIAFLGEDASFPTGPFQIAAITGVPVFPVLTLRQKLLHYEHRSFAPIRFDNVPRTAREGHIDQAMKTFTSILADAARSYPYQWFNFFDFWA